MKPFVVVLFLLLFFPGFIGGQEVTVSAPAPLQIPGSAEVVPRSSQLGEQASQIGSKISDLKNITLLEKQLKEARQSQEELNKRIEKLGDPKDWNYDRLVEIRGRLNEHNAPLKKILEDLSSRLASLESIRAEWEEKKSFWKSWENSIKKIMVPVSAEAFSQAKRNIEVVLGQVSEAFPPLVELQKQVTALKEKNQEISSQIDTALAFLRQKIFTKTAPSFSSSGYYRQFNSELWGSVKSNLTQVQGLSKEFLLSQGGIMALQAILAIVLALFIRHNRPKAEITKEWQFILRHPWATGIFVSVSSLSLLYTTPPALLRLALAALGAFSAAILIAGLLQNRRKIFMVILLATLYVLSLALQIIALPQPLYRLYLAAISLAGIPLLLVLAVRNKKDRPGKTSGFTWLLRLGAVILFISFTAQLRGYHVLAARLIEASVESIFLVLFATMAVRLGRGGIEYLLDLDFFQRYLFFARFGKELGSRIKALFQVFIIVYSGLYLLKVVGFYDSVHDAWDAIMDIGFAWGETFISVHTLFWAILVLYFSIAISWVIRAFLETEVFPRRGFDRGVRESIKKLLHYSLVFVGFLLAMGTAGFELKHFAVLAGAFGIGIGFGLQNIVNNFVSGLILLFERPVKIGDTIVLDGEWGTVKKIGLRSTIVETLDQSELIVPNSQLISEKVTNWTLTTPMARVVVPVGVAYGSDIDKVLSILHEAGENHPEVLADPQPSPIFTGFGNSSIDFELRTWIADVNKRLKTKSELGQYIDRRFREEDIVIPFPQSDLHLRSIDNVVLQKMRQHTEE